MKSKKQFLFLNDVVAKSYISYYHKGLYLSLIIEIICKWSN